METDWVRELKYLSKWVGFTMNPETRLHNLSYISNINEKAPEWSRAIDRAQTDIAFGPNIPNNLRHEFETQIQDLGPLRAFLYNAGVTHVVTPDEVEEFSPRPKNYNAVGTYFFESNIAVSEDEAGIVSISNDSLSEVVRHEAAHGFSYNISPVEYLRRAIVQDINALDMNALRDDQRQIIEEFINDDYQYFSSARVKSGGLLSTQIFQLSGILTLSGELKDDPTLRSHFPTVTPMMEDLHLFSDDYIPIEARLSNHPAIQTAYRDDLLDLIKGTAPNGAKLILHEIEKKGETTIAAHISIGEGENQILIYAGHYVPEEFEGFEVGGHHYIYESDSSDYYRTDASEEALADAFTSILSSEELQEDDRLSYFPRLRQEVEAISQAMNTLATRELDHQPSPASVASTTLNNNFVQ